MSRVRSKDTKPEMLLRRALHARGVRYRLHGRDILGNPDLVWRKRKVALFVDGDLWHGNAWRVRGLPSIEALFPTRTDWWTSKIRANEKRDHDVTAQLTERGWTVIRVWESSINGGLDAVVDQVISKLLVGPPPSRHAKAIRNVTQPPSEPPGHSVTPAPDTPIQSPP